MRGRALQSVLCAALVVGALPARASDPGDRLLTPLGGSVLGPAEVIAPKGNLALSLPLALPPPRGGLPLPFRVAYDGSNAVGAAGMGWDVPILGVTRQRNLSRRKPIHRFEGAPQPATADRLMVDIGNGPMLMAPTITDGVYQPFGNGYFELRSDFFGYTGRDEAGRVWIFRHIPELVDDDFWALVSVVDGTGKNRVDLAYDVYDKFSPSPVRLPLRPGELSMRELVVREITHSPDGLTGRCPKYRIDLEYVQWPDSGYPVFYPHLLGVEFQAARPRARTRILHRVRVHSSLDPLCLSFVLPTDRTYVLSYAPDALTGQPRLTKLDSFGANDPATDPATSQPVAAYQYGNALAPTGLEYADAEQLSVPAGPPGAAAVSASLTSGGIYGSVRGFLDLDGDGRQDFVTLDATSQQPLLSVNRASSAGNDFSTLDPAVALPNTPAAPYDLGAPDLSFGLPVLEAIDNVYQQVIDFNGDGRPDIVVATSGKNPQGKPDSNYWALYVNTPGPSGQPSDIVWLERQIDVTAVRAAIQARHHLSLTASSDDASKPLPLSRTIQVGAFANNISVESAVLTQWKLVDVNGDGFPDMVFDTKDVTAFDDVSCDAQGNCQDVLRQDHPPTTRLMVLYHTGPMMAGSGAETQNVWRGPPVLLRADGACGVERLVWKGNGIRELACGYLEVNGDGIPDYVTQVAGGPRAILSPGLAQQHDRLLPENQAGTYAQQEEKRSFPLPGPVGQILDRRATVCGSDHQSATPYTITQRTALVDVTGDGIADYVYFGFRGALADGTPLGHATPGPGERFAAQGWWMMAGTGAGFASSIPIHGPADVPFALRISEERCDGNVSSVVAMLRDVDGDGRPELVRAVGPLTLRIAKLVDGAGELGAHGAGQLVAMDNGYGAVTHVRYGSAKSSWLTRGRRAAPEIVVTETQRIAGRGYGTDTAPVRYAYGGASVVYSSPLGRWIFTGYRRRVTLIGETAAPGVVHGRAIVNDALSPGGMAGHVMGLALAGHPVATSVVVGDLPDDPRRLLADDPAFTPRSAEHLTWKVQPLPGPVPILVPLDEECYAVPSPQVPGQFGDLVLCRRAATPYVAEEASWEGSHPYPAPDAVARRRQVTAVDDYARPIQIHDEGDVARPDDDLCLQLDYADPAPGAALVLAVPHRVRALECGNPSRVLSGVRYRYDELPEGQASLGRVTSSVLERHDVSTAALLDQIETGAVHRDPFGNPVSFTRTRPDGATATTQVTMDPFGLRPVRVETTATGLAQPLVTRIDRDPQLLLPVTVTNAEGASTWSTYDGFGRRTQVSLTLPGDPERYLLADTTYRGFGPGLAGRVVTTRTYHRFTRIAVPPDPSTVTTFAETFDEAGHRMLGILDLGADYGGQSLVVDRVIYDGLDRPRFAADPFPAQGFVVPYGVTFTYDADGRGACAVAGTGPQTQATTDEAVDRYPTCVSYAYSDGTVRVRTRGPDDLAAGKPQSGAWDEAVLSATGQLLARSRWQGGTELARAEYTYDRLGALAGLTRYADAPNRAGVAAWSFGRDSLGSVLTESEPAGLTRRFAYDAWEDLASVSWRDSTGVVAVDRGLRFSYDGLARPIRSDETLNGAVQAGTAQEYGWDIPSGDPAQLAPTFLLGQLSFARAAGRSVFYGYDALGRLTTVSRADQGDPSVYAQRATVGPTGAAEALELLLPDHQGSPERILYSYDSAQRLRGVQYQDGAASLDAWRATAIDPLGRVLGATFGNGATESFTYRDGGRGELVSEQLQVGAQSRLVQLGRYDGAMLLQGQSETSSLPGTSSGSTVYTYDARNALAREVVQGPGGVVSDESYTFDGLGNARAITGGAGPTELRPDTLDPDRLCSVVPPQAPPGPCRYRYDALGSVWQIHDRGELFTYDGLGRLRGAERGARRARLGYEASGAPASLRMVGPAGQRQERYYGLATRVDLLDAAGNPTTGTGGFQHYLERRIVSPLGAVAVVRRPDAGAPAVLYPVEGRQGTRLVLGSGGEVVGSLSYPPFRAAKGAGDPRSLTYWPYGWNGGRVLDGFGLVALGHRVLDPSTNRFLQRDPIVQSAGAVAAHPYAFAVNDPVNGTDASGLDCIGAIECGGLAEFGLPGGGPGVTSLYDNFGPLPPQFTDDDIYGPTRAVDERLQWEEAQRRAREEAIALKQLEWWDTHREGIVAGWTTAQLEANDIGAAINSVPIYSTGTPYFAEAEISEELDLLPDVSMGRISGRLPPAADVLHEASPGFENAARGWWTSGTARGSFTLRMNQAGGKLYTSRGIITMKDFAPLVDEALSRGETVNILTGVHGGLTGRTTGALGFRMMDVARFNKPGVVIWNFDTMTTQQITQVLNSNETIIAAFCYSGTCLKPYMGP